jgi:hypothetical protein
MEDPYTKEKLKSMTNEELLKIKNSIRLHPYCLVGLHIDEVRQRMNLWNPNSKIIIYDKDGCTMSFNTDYYYCKVDKHNIMTKVFPAFEYNT